MLLLNTHAAEPKRGCFVCITNVLTMKRKLHCCFIVAEKVISMHNLSLNSAKLTVQKAKYQGLKGKSHRHVGPK